MWASRSTSTYQVVYHFSYSTYLPLPPTGLPSQPGMKAGWHLTKGINHPWPWTNYPSLPTLCPPLRGELCNNSATWKSSASQGRALMEAPVRLCLLRSPGRLTFKSLSLSDSTPTKQAIVQDKGPWPLEMKWRCRGWWEGSQAGNGRSKVGENKKVSKHSKPRSIFVLFVWCLLLRNQTFISVCQFEPLNYLLKAGFKDLN